MSAKNHDKIQPLCNYFALRVYYRVKNIKKNSNYKVKVYVFFLYLFYRAIFQTLHILRGQLE